MMFVTDLIDQEIIMMVVQHNLEDQEEQAIVTTDQNPQQNQIYPNGINPLTRLKHKTIKPIRIRLIYIGQEINSFA